MATKDISDYDCCVAATFGFGNGGSVRTGEALVYRTGQHEKVCERAIERAVRRGYLDYGINAWNAFLTDKGRELLECQRLGTTTKTDASEAGSSRPDV